MRCLAALWRRGGGGAALLLVGLLCGGAGAARAADPAVKDAVVKIYTVANRYNYHEPWQTVGQRLVQGSGCVIAGQRILTAAHVVSDQTFVQVRRAGQVRKYTARVELVGHECDLALLRVDDPEFFAGITPLELGELPGLQDRVAVYGYPDGGDTLSITEGVLSRVEHREYLHSQANLLAGQIDAAINSGNSGGPVMRDGRIVGVAFQGLNGPSYENIGYMVPASVIRHFLDDIADGRYDGFPELGLSMQKLENPDLRRSFALGEAEAGALVNKVYPDSPATGLLQADDVLLSIDGLRIENDGTIEFRPGERTYLGELWQRKQLGDQLSVRLSRQGKVQTVTIPLTRSMGFERLVPNMRYDRPASYYIVGGLVFAPLTLNYLKEYGMARDGARQAPTELLFYYIQGEPEPERRQVVLLIKVLADELNSGYHAFTNGIISRVNGHNVATIDDVVAAIESNSEPFHVIEDIRGYRLVLDREKTLAQSRDILTRYRIPAERSADLLSRGVK